MAKTMTPSATITDGQIEKAVSSFRNALIKKRAELPSDAAQLALGTDNLGMRLLQPFRELVKVSGNIIIRRSTPNVLSNREALVATGCKLVVNNQVVEAMPDYIRSDGETVFFRLAPNAHGGWISDDDLELEYKRRGLVPEDPRQLAKVNEDDRTFCDKHKHSTHWKDNNGGWCYISFYRWVDDLIVVVDVRSSKWQVNEWFAGRRSA